MDIERIYCAEQIVIPPTLGDILKAYTKDVIRKSTDATTMEELLEFSHQYFAKLAQDTSTGRVNADILAGLRGKLSLHDTQMTGKVSFEVLQSMCNQVGLSESDLEKCLRLAEYEGGEVDWNEFVVLSCTLIAEDRSGVVKGLLQVYDETGQQSVTWPKFYSLFKYVMKVDTAVSSEFVEALGAHLKKLGVNVNFEEYQNFIDTFSPG